MKIRVISGVVLSLVATLFLFFVNDFVFLVALILLGIIASSEITKLIVMPYSVQLTFYISMVATQIYTYVSGPLNIEVISIIFLAFIVIAILNKRAYGFEFDSLATSFMMFLYVCLTFNALLFIQMTYGVKYTLFVILVSLVCDTMGYFGGMFFGRRKLIETISPKKTIEGAISTTVFGVSFAIIYLITVLDTNVLAAIFVALAMVMLSQFGDLFASLIKRTYRIKDFSHLIPGHGGILDRLDAILFNMLAFQLVLVMFL